MTTNKTALITGGSRGLGRDMAIQTAKKGIDIILTYHAQEAEAEKVVSEIQALGRAAKAFQLDSGNIKSFEGFFKEVAAYQEKTSGARILISWSTMQALPFIRPLPIRQKNSLIPL